VGLYSHTYETVRVTNMLRNAITGRLYPHLPTIIELQRRRTELPALPRQPQPDHDNPPPELDPSPQPEPAKQSPRTDQFAKPNLPEVALHGIAGRAVRTIAPHTEAHPAALLLQLLAVFGNLLGRGPHCMVDATRHSLNLFLVLVGDSSKARKGTSWNQIARLFAEVDQPWLSTRVTTARLTATGLFHALRDQPPPADRRCLLLSEEFASVLHTLKKGNSHLSPLLRCAWDTGHLPTATANLNTHPQTTPTHISLIAHVTQRELAQNLHRTEAHNGFANRCLWAWVERSNCLPEGGNVGAHELTAIARELRRALDWAGATPEILFRRDTEARELWHDRYPALSQLRPGLRGAATSRAEAQVLRLSAIYAALDATPTVGLPHLQAALAVWDYCYASASHLFGMSTGEPIADRIREAIEASQTGLPKNQIRRLFHGHVESHRIDAALEQLVALGALTTRTEPTGGRPSTLWSATEENEPKENEEPLAEEDPTQDQC
jgi:Protein of unknown function (DUF3987)